MIGGIGNAPALLQVKWPSISSTLSAIVGIHGWLAGFVGFVGNHPNIRTRHRVLSRRKCPQTAFPRWGDPSQQSLRLSPDNLGPPRPGGVATNACPGGRIEPEDERRDTVRSQSFHRGLARLVSGTRPSCSCIVSGHDIPATFVNNLVLNVGCPTNGWHEHVKEAD